MTETQTWRLAVNRSYRSPSAFEQKSSMVFANSAPIVVTPRFTVPAGTPISQTFRPSPGLSAERITTYELGYLAELRSISTTFDARLFLERARDLIEMNLENSTIGLLPRSNTRYFSNSGEADIRGVELAATWRPGTTTWLTVQHTELRIDGPTLGATQALTRPSGWVEYTAPRHSSSLFGAWEFTPGWQLSLSKRWVGSMSWYQDADHKAPMYRQLDVRLAHRLAPSIARGEVAIALRNIDGADETYAPGTSSWGSRIFGSLNVEF
jgi:iron complex outermembrane receptor protein